MSVNMIVPVTNEGYISSSHKKTNIA